MGDLETGLLEWSKRLADWQRDLLRRLAAGEILGAAQIREYASTAERNELLREAPWFTPPELGDTPKYLPLDKTHLTATVHGGDPVRLAKILHLQGANDLADGAALEFSPIGLTIVAGRNGSGKSGYTRILKQVAACKASEAVLPNAYNPSKIPKGVVSFHIGETEVQELTWQADADRVESPLQRVRVFDAKSANVHLAGATQIAYVPTTLQILAEYTRVLQEITAVIDADLQVLRLQKRSWPALEVGPGERILANLGSGDSLAALQELTPLNPDEEAELEAIPAKLRDLTASNSAALAVHARQRAGQLNTLARNLELIAAKLSSEAIGVSKRLRTEFGEAKARASEARSLVESEDFLPRTGTEDWQVMWNAAREFAEADHEHVFPDSSVDAHCPLCQQQLDEESRDKLSRLAEFMNGEAQSSLSTAQTIRNADVDALNALPLNSIITQDLVDLVSTYDDDVSKTLLPMIAEALRIRDLLLASTEDESQDYDSSTLQTALSETIASLRAASTLEIGNAEGLEATDTSAIAAAQLDARRISLTTRKALVAELEAIGTQHDHAIRSERLAASKGACNTSSASRKNSDLSTDYVNKVCQQFELEAKTLGLERVPVALVFDGSERGVSYIKVSLKNAPQIPVSSVLSEGEQRVTAIAGFFADLTESGDSSTLVFDDPVSSLDHEYRVKVAQRLLEEAESRQVLVFTHDFSFVQYLYEEKGIRDVQACADGKQPATDIAYLHIDRAASGAGVVTTAEEWRHVSVKERIGRLKQRIQNAAVLYRNNDMGGYGALARDIVGAIRDTWEAFIEQELLNGVITRHDRRVQSQRLAKLTDLTDADLATVDLGMTIESRYMTGHASPVSDGTAPMSPDELTAEVQRLEVLRNSVLTRRR